MRTPTLLTALITLGAALYWAQRSGPTEPPKQSAPRPTSSSVEQSASSAAEQRPQPTQRTASTPSRAERPVERLEGDSALKEPKRPLNATLRSVTPSPRDASWRPGQTLELGWHEAPLPEGEGLARVRLSMSAESAEGHRVAAALRPRVLKSLYFLLSHRASGALTLPDAEARLASDLNERLARMSGGYRLEVHIEALEVRFQ